MNISKDSLAAATGLDPLKHLNNEVLHIVFSDQLTVLEKTLVDGTPWYTVYCSTEVGNWIRKNFPEQEDKTWYQHIDRQGRILDIDESIYCLLLLKYGK